MLGGFIERQHYRQPESIGEYFSGIVNAFDGCVDFLRDPQRFPNAEINKVAALMWRLIGNKQIPAVLDTEWNLPSVSFMVLADGPNQLPLVVLPKDIVKQVQQEPVIQLGIIGYIASQCRDFYCAKINRNNSAEINTRAQAFEAETLLTIQRMAALEGITFQLLSIQREYLSKFPQGLASLPSAMHYSTPEFSPPPLHNEN